MVHFQIRIFGIFTWSVVIIVHVVTCSRVTVPLLSVAKQFLRSVGFPLVVDRLGVVRLLAKLA